jgi:cytochrome c biogenesis protein CcdA
VTLGCSSENDNNYGSFASLETNFIDKVIDLSLIILVTGARILGVYDSRMKTFFTSFYYQLEQLVPHSILKTLGLGFGLSLGWVSPFKGTNV